MSTAVVASCGDFGKRPSHATRLREAEGILDYMLTRGDFTEEEITLAYEWECGLHAAADAAAAKADADLPHRLWRAVYVVRAETTQGYHPPERKVANPPQKGAYAHAYYQEHKEQLKAERRERYAQQPKRKPKTFAELMADARKRLTARRSNGKG